MIKKLLMTSAMTITLLFMLALTGCGQTGPLYLPEDKPEKKTSTK